MILTEKKLQHYWIWCILKKFFLPHHTSIAYQRDLLFSVKLFAFLHPFYKFYTFLYKAHMLSCAIVESITSKPIVIHAKMQWNPWPLETFRKLIQFYFKYAFVSVSYSSFLGFSAFLLFLNELSLLISMQQGLLIDESKIYLIGVVFSSSNF